MRSGGLNRVELMVSEYVVDVPSQAALCFPCGCRASAPSRLVVHAGGRESKLSGRGKPCADWGYREGGGSSLPGGRGSPGLSRVRNHTRARQGIGARAGGRDVQEDARSAASRSLTSPIWPRRATLAGARPPHRHSWSCRPGAPVPRTSCGKETRRAGRGGVGRRGERRGGERNCSRTSCKKRA